MGLVEFRIFGVAVLSVILYPSKMRFFDAEIAGQIRIYWAAFQFGNKQMVNDWDEVINFATGDSIKKGKSVISFANNLPTIVIYMSGFL